MYRPEADWIVDKWLSPRVETAWGRDPYQRLKRESARVMISKRSKCNLNHNTHASLHYNFLRQSRGNANPYSVIEQ